MSAAVQVPTFPKTTRERVVVSRGEYRGREYTSVWVHWLTPAGDWVPSRKGLTLRSELVPELEDALRYVRTQPAPAALRPAPSTAEG